MPILGQDLLIITDVHRYGRYICFAAEGTTQARARKGNRHPPEGISPSAASLCLPVSVSLSVARAGSRSSVAPPLPPKKGCVRTGQVPPPARHLHRGLWKHSVPVGGAAATKLPAGGAHLCHCEIQDLTSGSTQQPPLSSCPCIYRHAWVVTRLGSTQPASTIHTAYHIVCLPGIYAVPTCLFFKVPSTPRINR